MRAPIVRSYLSIVCRDASYDNYVYLDFKKAFDSVPHNELLVKLWSIGNLWKWFQAYLSCRSQHVLLNHVTSDPLPVISGVPQGSILGPLMFLIIYLLMTYLLPSSTPIYSFLLMIQNASGMYLLCLIVIHFKMTWYIYPLGA